MNIVNFRVTILKITQITEMLIEKSKWNTKKKLNYPLRNQKMRNKEARSTIKTKWKHGKIVDVDEILLIITLNIND